MRSFLRKPLHTFLLLLLAVNNGSTQEVQVTEQAAKEAVYQIIQYSGLEANFVVLENDEVKTAIAYIKNKKRYVEYNPQFIASIADSSKTDWSAISILAHEIAHHLLGHTLDPGKVSPGDELACDKYSGFILRSMGASLPQSLAAMQIAGDPHGTKTHPPAAARLKAIEQGWRDPDRLASQGNQFELTREESFTHRLRFLRDENNYYVTHESHVVWFNNYAEPIEFGLLEDLEEHDFSKRITWGAQVFYVDHQNHIWSKSTHGVQTKVGELTSLIDD